MAKLKFPFFKDSLLPNKIFLNLLAGVVTLILFYGIVQSSSIYRWAWEIYVKHNLREVKSLPTASMESRMAMKLGEDYQYLVFIRNTTPDNAVIYYPSQGDFLKVLPGMARSPFNGRLNDKLTAIRILYPRRIVTEDEYGKTPWSNKLTHIAIVNRCNLDKVPYQVEEDYYTGVLPLDSTLRTYN